MTENLLNAGDLLKLTKPEDLFPGDLDLAKEKYYELAKHWHPDTCRHEQATQVFQHIQGLYNQAFQKMITNTWSGRSSFNFPLKYRKAILTIHAFRSHPFELGIYYVGEDFVAYVLNKEFKHLWINAQLKVSKFQYASPSMEKEVSRYLPTKTDFLELSDGRYVMYVYKHPEYLLLRDVLNFYHKIDFKHLAWIQSSLHNLACYLSYAGIVHHDISLDTYFISPKNHVGALLGGWFYAKPVKSKLENVSVRTFKILPWESKMKKVAIQQTDLELIRCVGKELAGKHLDDMPKPMSNRLRNLATDSALKDYSEWRQALEKSYGKRTFVPMILDSQILYRR